MTSNPYSRTAVVDLVDPYNDIRASIINQSTSKTPDKDAGELLNSLVDYTLCKFDEKEGCAVLKQLHDLVGESDRVILHDIDVRVMSVVGNLTNEELAETMHATTGVGFTTIIIPNY